MLHSQEGQQVALPTYLAHDPPRRTRVFASPVLRPRRELRFGEVSRIMPHNETVVSIKLA
jgi:hypothetical protein